MNILLIGFDHDTDFVCQTIKNRTDIKETVLWDKNGGPDCLTPEFLTQFDCIIIAVKDLKTSGDLFTLISMILDDDSHIIDFYRLYRACMPFMKADRIMTNHPEQKYDGMILGISHAEVGLIPRCFDGNFCNLAVTSQDIYFNMKTLEYCLVNYPEKIRNLKYLILDLYDYTYFNYDTSLSKNTLNYYSLGGYLDAHNFARNKHFHDSFENVKTDILANRFRGMTDSMESLWNELFPDIYTQYDYLEFPFITTTYLRTKVIQDKDIEKYYANTSIVEKIFHDTIQENIQHFYELLDLLYRINSQIKIYLILLPRNFYAQQKGNALYPQYTQWKEMFETILEEANKTYPFTYLNFKDHEISKEMKYYYDVSHFNYYGAVTFSKLLNSMIKN